jgi:hypothetical protein
MGALARARALAGYDINRLVADIAALYQSLLAER